jgi:hypothetical protein
MFRNLALLTAALMLANSAFAVDVASPRLGKKENVSAPTKTVAPGRTWHGKNNTKGTPESFSWGRRNPTGIENKQQAPVPPRG